MEVVGNSLIRLVLVWLVIDILVGVSVFGVYVRFIIVVWLMISGLIFGDNIR